ncbi:lytic murein transglycosylase [Microbispora triticiradicis]|uniref:lytic transglycosylase domain-containing protein n=1 Tax=Microbispora triticiradicis TaxID=2200763 RepID=UPI001AD7ADD5|nr:lytic murein transglycosylase [Microbispora triticiradicis]MBO4270455.1 transglycosylase SLT domain-containing protein [Microbispora triticiradicis]
MNDQRARTSHVLFLSASRRPRLLAGLLAGGLAGLVSLSGCAGARGEGSPAVSGGAEAPAASATPPEPPSGGPSAPATPEQPPPAEAKPPAPDAKIPRDPAALAEALTRTTALLRDAVDDWRRTGDPARGQAPEPVVLLALYEQRLYRHLARNPGVASRTYGKLSKDQAARARDNVTAVRDLLSLAHPVSGPVKFRIEPPEPADVLLDGFRRAGRRFGIDWQVLAAVMLVETKFGRVRSPSYVGAKGPMQFMPGTWKAYGMGGDIDDTRDALLAAANYLHASGAPGDYRRALYAYNHSQAYVDAVLLHARQMKRDIRNYYAYYNWQVYVITTKGERRLSGP